MKEALSVGVGWGGLKKMKCGWKLSSKYFCKSSHLLIIPEDLGVTAHSKFKHVWFSTFLKDRQEVKSIRSTVCVCVLKFELMLYAC
jgi:hypothetical protein